ncbi:peptidoglycan DD-metalloendopeptidase family protein [Paenibacillus sp. GP183]|uniref:murein hydrolase activator EnvC family protein n=1 Tax=Paenibacillus sp. GP183 TaxID=1882751 RepID=UPI000898FF00|nr:peptidoglycan DD-metalloendopeptidase family protein [Paenibacillus sp. GP183]SEC35250.1 Murein DD-endopeptidase MepM and murein hydrolase activator NlpD, contain LysM domain [Paenibacillus sp. GP183]
MNKQILPFIITLTMAGMLMVPYAGFAATSTAKIDQELNQLKQKQADAKQKAADTSKQINQVQTEKVQTAQDMNTLLGQLNDAGKKLSDLNGQIDTVTENLQVNGKLLDEAVDRVAKRDQMLKSRLRLMYMNGFVSYMDVLLSATSFSDFLSRLDALKSIVNQDKEILASNKKDRDTVALKKDQTEKQLAEVKQLYEQADQVRNELQVKEKEKEVKIASLSKMEKNLEQISEENEKLLIQFAAQEAALQAKKRAAAKADTSNLFTYSGGKFGFPLVIKAPLTSDFGYRVNPVTGKKDEFHKGIDFGAPNGTSIVAAENGVVIVASWWSGYGNTVIIDHGNGVWTLYGHIRNDGTVVKKGDIVKRGQKIAEVGSTGQSTGNHLHFEVRKNEQPIDPKPFLR